MILRRILSILIVVNFIFSITNHPINPAVAVTEDAKPTLETAQKVLQSQNGFFTENKGQWDSEILFIGDTSFGKVAFAKDAIYYQMVRVTEKEEKKDSALSMEDIPVRFDQREMEREYESQVVKLAFVDSLAPTIQGAEVLPHYNNYFIGNDPKKWASYCRNFATVTYEDVWKGIDLAYFFTPEGMKYEYYVEPEADIQELQIKVEGADLLSLGTSLQISTTLGNIQDANLLVFEQETNKVLRSNFVVKEDVYSFKGIPEKRENTIVIDPLVFSTYIGGSNHDEAKSVAVDIVGCSYIGGATLSSTDLSFMKSSPGYDKNHNKQLDGFIVKFNNTGTQIVYSTYIGGLFDDVIEDLEVDINGCVYLTGTTSSNEKTFPIGGKIPGFDPVYNCFGDYSGYEHMTSDAFALKLNYSGTSILYSTYIGGISVDKASALSVDSSGCAYVCGITKSNENSFPVNKGIPGFDKNNGNNEYIEYLKKYIYIEDESGFLIKLNYSGTKLLYSTFIGGSSFDEAIDITVDSKGNAYLVGTTFSKRDSFPIDNGISGLGKSFDGDIFLLKINTESNKILFFSMFGVTSYPESIALDKNANIFICGRTSAPSQYGFPIIENTPGFQKEYKGLTDAFVTKFNSTGTKILFSTYIGGKGHDIARSIFIDKNGCPIVVGTTSSPEDSFPISDLIPGYQKKYNSWDGFIVKLSSSGESLSYSSFIGGSKGDSASSVVLDKNDLVYISGVTNSTDFPLIKSTQSHNKGNGDAFLIIVDLGQDSKKNPPKVQKPKLESFPDLLDFGSILSSDNPTKVFPIKNSGDGNLEGYIESTRDWILTDPRKFNQLTPIIAVSIVGSKLALGENFGQLIIESNGGDQIIEVIVTLLEDKKPKIEIKTPADISQTSDSEVHIIGQATDRNSRIESIAINGDELLFDVDGSFEYFYPLFIGKNELEIVIINADKIVNSKHLIVYRTDLDSEMFTPTIQLDSPTNYQVFFKESIHIEGTIKEKGSGIDLVFINGQAIFSTNKEGLPDTSLSFAFELYLNLGKNTIKVEVYDRVGNKETKEVIVIREKKKIVFVQLTIGHTNVIINGQVKIMDAAPFIDQPSGRTLVPIRFIVEAINGNIEYEAKNRQVTITKEQIVVILWIDKPIALINGTPTSIDITAPTLAPRIINERTFLPLRFVAESLGAVVDFDSKTQTITITFLET